MIKILHIAESFGGGVFIFLADLCNGLCDCFDMSVAYSKRDETPALPENYFDSRVKLIETRHGKREINPVDDTRYLLEIKKLIKTLAPDIVHLHSSKAGFVGRMATLGDFSGRIFYTAHGYSFLKGGGSAFKRGLYYALEKLAGMANCTTMAVGLDEYRVAGRLSNQVGWVNNGVNIKHISKLAKPRPISKKPVVATMGRIDRQKNPTLFNEIATSLPHFPFIWIGGGNESGKLTAQNISITGWQEHEFALSALSKADLFILPSLGEGLPLSLLEAMAMGKICVAADAPGIREILRNGENGFLASSAGEYTEIITDIVSGKYDTESISTEAYNTISEKYSLEGMCRGYSAVYNGCFL